MIAAAASPTIITTKKTRRVASHRRIPSLTSIAVGGRLTTATKIAARIGTTIDEAAFMPATTMTRAASTMMPPLPPDVFLGTDAVMGPSVSSPSFRLDPSGLGRMRA